MSSPDDAFFDESLATPAPNFLPGELVRHGRYGYRGVVAGYDLVCQADDAWYQANQTHPDRNQPWYHVLVDDQRGSITYAAQSSLEADTTGREVDHPLVPYLFDDFRKGVYRRNAVAFPPETTDGLRGE